MNQTPLHVINALLRHSWAIEPVSAEAYLPLIDAYLTGRINPSVLQSDGDTNRPIGYAMDEAGERIAMAGADEDEWTGRPFANPNLPQGTVAVLDIRGVIMKEGLCWSYGTQDYAQAMQDIYDNSRIIGAVLAVDSPGGQLAGTPTLFDQIIRPDKPVVGLIQDGMAGSAAYWFLSGCEYIYATQKTDQVGSIGVFVRLRDNTEQLKQNGIRELAIYSNLSSDKNRPYREAIAGKPELLQAELDESARLFREAVELGRGSRLTPEAQQAFKGAVYYASKGIELGLIDGFGDLKFCIAKVQELAAAGPQPDRRVTAGSVRASAETEAPTLAQTTQTDSLPAPIATAEESTGAGMPDHDPVTSVATTENPQESLPIDSNSNSNQNPTEPMALGFFHLKALDALSKTAIADRTAAQFDAANQELVEKGIEGVTLVSDSEAAQIGQVASLNTKITEQGNQITTLTNERDQARQQASQFGAQPGAVPSRAQKTEETVASADDDKELTETDVLANQLKAQLHRTR